MFYSLHFRQNIVLVMVLKSLLKFWKDFPNIRRNIKTLRGWWSQTLHLKWINLFCHQDFVFFFLLLEIMLFAANTAFKKGLKYFFLFKLVCSKAICDLFCVIQNRLFINKTELIKNLSSTTQAGKRLNVNFYW